MNIIDIDKKLEIFDKLIQEFGTSIFISKEIWTRQREIAENFKAAQFIDDNSKNTTTQKFQHLINQLKEKENQVVSANEKFTNEGENLVFHLENLYNKISTATPLEKSDFIESKKNINQIFEYFKLPKWVSKERRTMAWDKYNFIRNSIKEIEDKMYASFREEKTNQISQSLEITEKLCVVVGACHPSVVIDDLKIVVEKFNQFLIDTNLTELNNTWHLIEKPEDIKFSIRCRTETLNDVRNFIVNYKDYLTREHKGQIFATIDALKIDLNKAWESHKEDQQKKQEEWEIKKKEREEKRVEWTNKQLDFLAMLENRLENQIAYKAKQESYLQSQKEYATRFESRIPQQKEYIQKLQEQLIDLEKKHVTAWTDSFKLKVEEWMKEKQLKVETVEKDIDAIKEKIVDINKNIEELPNKILELDETIVELNAKILEVKHKLTNDSVNIELKEN